MSPNPFSVVTTHPPSLDLQRRIAQERVPTIGTTPDRAGARPYHESHAGSRRSASLPSERRRIARGASTTPHARRRPGHDIINPPSTLIVCPVI